MSTQTEIFRRVVRDHMGARPVIALPDQTCGALVQAIIEQQASCALVCDRSNRPHGIVTEQDIVRRLAFQLPPETPVSSIMTTPVVVVESSDYLFHAIAIMRRRGLRHIPVIDHDRAVAGMLALDEALTQISESTMELIDRLTHEATVEGLKKVKLAQIEVAEALFHDHVPVPEVQALLTEINRDIHARVVRRTLADLVSQGWGEPPVEFSLIIMGSGGRGENFLLPDQDNGFIIEDYPDEDHTSIDLYFLELADRMTKQLDEIGFPLCRGNIMATNPVWRKTLSQWKEQITYWMGRRSNVNLRMSDIFFDFKHGYGAEHLSNELRGFVTDMAARNPGFLKEMFLIEADHRVALGWFGRLMRERDKQNREGMINLKYGGTLPLVEGIRLLSLKHGVPRTSTLNRIAELHDKEVLSDSEQDYLKGGLRHITSLLLREQIADYKSGGEVDNFVAEDSLSKREKDYLVACFKAVAELRGRLRTEFTGDAL